MSGGGGDDNKVKDTPEQKYLAQVAAEKWNFAQEELAPLENEYMATVGRMDSEGNMSYIRGRTMQAQTQAQTRAQADLDKGLGRAGIDPSSGRWQGDQTGLALDVATAGGENLGRAQFEQDNQKILGLQNVVAIGQGQSGPRTGRPVPDGSGVVSRRDQRRAAGVQPSQRQLAIGGYARRRGHPLRHGKQLGAKRAETQARCVFHGHRIQH